MKTILINFCSTIQLQKDRLEGMTAFVEKRAPKFTSE